MPIKNILFISLTLFIVYIVLDKLVFINYGSIRPVIDASTKFKSINELSIFCKKEKESLVLKIVQYDINRSYARCETQFFAQTWDVSKLK